MYIVSAAAYFARQCLLKEKSSLRVQHCCTAAGSPRCTPGQLYAALHVQYTHEAPWCGMHSSISLQSLPVHRLCIQQQDKQLTTSPRVAAACTTPVDLGVKQHTIRLNACHTKSLFASTLSWVACNAHLCTRAAKHPATAPHRGVAWVLLPAVVQAPAATHYLCAVGRRLPTHAGPLVTRGDTVSPVATWLLCQPCYRSGVPGRAAADAAAGWVLLGLPGTSCRLLCSDLDVCTVFVLDMLHLSTLAAVLP